MVGQKPQCEGNSKRVPAASTKRCTTVEPKKKGGGGSFFT